MHSWMRAMSVTWNHWCATWARAARVASCLLIGGHAALVSAQTPPADGTTPAAPLTSVQLQALERATQSVVAVRSEAVEGARSARTLGPQREGSGVVIGTEGLILTIGYLVLEADAVVVEDHHGRMLPARVVAQDLNTGLAVLQTLAPLRLQPAPLGEASGAGRSDPLLVASGGEGGQATLATLLSRRAYSGYWEYHLDEALYTTPARRDHSGAGLFNLRGELVGVGSLVLNNVASTGQPRTAGNLFVPVDLFRPVLEQLQRSGRWAGDTRAWLGVNCTEREGEIWVVRVAEDSPAERAGLAVGDRIVSIDGEAVTELSALWKTLWRGQAEREVTLQVRRHGLVRQVLVRTIDRATTLKQATGV
ncbi:MAG: S1C family serine protease [Rubrivivax sp.]